MKTLKTLFITKLTVLLFLAQFSICSAQQKKGDFAICLRGQSDTLYLRRTYDHLKQIRSASYFWHQSASVPYDTIPSLSYKVFKKEFDNPEDLFVGASVASFQFEDTTKLVYFYDGKMQSYLDWENKTIPVDNFRNNRYSFRVVYPPFFTQVKCLLKYALESPDKKVVQINDLTDSVLIRLHVYDRLVEVVGNRIVYADPSNLTEEKWTKYDIWIDKVNNLPCRLIKRFPDRVCWEVCKNIKINTLNTMSFVASEYFPPDFALENNDGKKRPEKNLVGSAAPGWILRDTDNKVIALSDLKSKVLIIHFTGIGCGPCHQSVPYLKKIMDEYPREEFETISIETWTNDPSAIKKYISGNGIRYKYLVGSNEVKLKYGIQSVPKFFVLDEKRVIRKMITGFDKDKTYVELKETVDQLVNE